MKNFNKKLSSCGICILMVFLLSFSYGQVPDTIWTKTYGGANYDYCFSMQIARDGGYVLGAETASRGAGGWDMWLIKTNNNGDTLWTRTYGGIRDDNCRSVLQTSDGGYLLSGSSRCFSNPPYYPDIYVIKTDSLGDTLWTRTYGGQVTDISYAAQQTTDGGYIIAGSTWSYGPGGQSGYLVKIDSLGDTLWNRTYGGAGEDLFHAVQQTLDHGYIICGETASFGAGNYDAWLVKTDSLGDTLWTRTYGGLSWDYGLNLDQTYDGGYIITGRTNSMGVGGSDLWLIKTDANGNMQWLKTYGNTGAEEGRDVHQLGNGGYIVGGGQESPPGSGYSDAYLVRTDLNGDTLWTKTYGYNGYFDWIFSLQITPDTGYIAVGSTNAYGAGLTDVWLLKLDADTFCVQEIDKKTKLLFDMIISPNPFRNNTVISFDCGANSKGILIGDINQPFALKIYDASGRLVKDYELSNNVKSANQIIWDGDNNKDISMPPGVYFIKMIRNKQTTINKVVKLN